MASYARPVLRRAGASVRWLTTWTMKLPIKTLGEIARGQAGRVTRATSASFDLFCHHVPVCAPVSEKPPRCGAGRTVPSNVLRWGLRSSKKRTSRMAVERNAACAGVHALCREYLLDLAKPGCHYVLSVNKAAILFELEDQRLELELALRKLNQLRPDAPLSEVFVHTLVDLIVKQSSGNCPLVASLPLFHARKEIFEFQLACGLYSSARFHTGRVGVVHVLEELEDIVERSYTDPDFHRTLHCSTDGLTGRKQMKAAFARWGWMRHLDPNCPGFEIGDRSKKPALAEAKRAKEEQAMRDRGVAGLSVATWKLIKVLSIDMGLSTLPDVASELRKIVTAASLSSP